jgi:hypothetical protein
MSTLELNFAHPDEEAINQCIRQLKDVSKIDFDFEIRNVDPRDILTKPEYLNVAKSVKLHFKTPEDLHSFRNSKECYNVYQYYAIYQNHKGQ